MAAEYRTEREITAMILEAAQGKRRLLVTLDGPCAGGKSTLASALARELSAAVLHTDDFVVPHAQKTAERLSQPGGNCHWERLTEETLLPWKAGKAASFRRYDCQRDLLLPAEAVPDKKILILEGSYGNLPAIRALADVRVFVTAPKKRRMERLARRETPEALDRFFSLWIPLENAYFAAFGLPDEDCVLYSTESGLAP